MGCPAVKSDGGACGWATVGDAWCWHHDPLKGGERQAARDRAAASRLNPAVTCLWCGGSLGRNQTRWDSSTCRDAGQRAKRLGLPLRSGVEVGKDSRRAVEKLDFDLIERMRKANLTYRQIGDYTGRDASTVSRRHKEGRIRAYEVGQRADWKPAARSFPEGLRDLSLEVLEVLVADFLGFRGQYFKTPWGEDYETPKFQRKWLRKILTALITGGRLIILSPPRHGKTELLIHIVVWLICRFPNIRIIWVGGNIDIAKQAVGSVLDHLENNEDLIRDFCPPGLEFKPSGKQGVLWTQSAIRVATRTVRGIKQPTLRAVGRGGRLRSMDTDFIVNDDIEDEKSTVQAMGREETRRWWTTGPDSRKESHSALFYIGSRAHPDDLGGHLLDNAAYEAVVEHAHAVDCDLPVDDPEAHVDCMLFPQLRSYAWLMEQKMSSETVGGLALFDMLYQNLPTGDGFDMFTAEAVLPCRSESHIVGRPALGGGSRLVAGLDPAGSGFQAAFLWNFQVQPELKVQMIDTENREGGGIKAARESVRRWWDMYGCSHWVVEENLYQGGIVDDDDIRAFCQKYGIRLESFRTYRNKIDPRIGVTSLQPMFAAKQIILPYGDAPSRAKTDVYVRQLLHYDGYQPRNRNTRGGYKSDLVMSSWFPMDVVRRAQMEFIAEMGVLMEDMPFTPDDWDDAPWDDWPAWAS